MKNKYPCLGCEDRVLGCHDRCEKYAQVKKEIQEEKVERWREHEADSYRRGVVVRNKAYKIKEKAR